MTWQIVALISGILLLLSLLDLLGEINKKRLLESSSSEQQTQFLHYLQKKQLAQMDRSRLSGILWLMPLLRLKSDLSVELQPKTIDKNPLLGLSLLILFSHLRCIKMLLHLIRFEPPQKSGS